ncbi:MAG: rod shape-determining protein MreD [Calditrichota bacterium]
MDRILKYIGLGLVAIILQLTVSDWISIMGVKPDFITLFVLYVGYKEGKVYGILFGFAFGLLQDMVAASAFIGLSALIKSILGFGAGFLQGKFHMINPVVLYGIIGLLILFGQVLYFGIYYAASPMQFGAMLQHLILPTFAYTLVVGSLLLITLPIKLQGA